MDACASRLLIPSTLPPTTGAQRVALHSLFRLVCEANQLVVNDVITKLNAPLFGPAEDRNRNLAKSVHLVDAGLAHSGRMVPFLERLTGLENLKALTLADFVGMKGIAALWTRPYRRWCPHCYAEDLASGLTPYDRLLWSIDLVRCCPVHETALRFKCDHCGGDRAPHRFGRDISGFCPRCFGWLGERPPGKPANADDQTKYLQWVARSFADLLDVPSLAEADLLPGIQASIRKLAILHHDGATTYVARQIGRNKSVVSTWLGGKSRPAWDALCNMSYVYQQPLYALLVGDVTGITISEPLPLPTAAHPRQGLRRKRPLARDPAVVVRILDEIATGLHPGVKSVQQVADRLNMNVREVYRIAQEEAKAASAAVARRNAAVRLQTAAYRLTERETALRRVAETLTLRESKVTRRIVHQEMAKIGFAVRWSESKEVLSRVRNLVVAAEDKGATLASASGTS
jgi:hypothetical protein